MHTRKISIISGLILMFALTLVPMARADEWDQSTKLTFNQPIEIPGHKILAAGTYRFVTMADFSSANDNVVRIFDADQTKLIAVVPTVAIERSKPSTTTELNFAEPQGNQPKVLVSWFYPDTRTGHEFLYSSLEEQTVASEPEMKVMAHPGATAYGD